MPAPLPMNRKILLAVLGVIIVVGLFFGYRAYKLAADRELAAQRAAAQLALIKEHGMWVEAQETQ